MVQRVFSNWSQWREHFDHVLEGLEAVVEDDSNFKAVLSSASAGNLKITRSIEMPYHVGQSQQSGRVCSTERVTVVVKELGRIGLDSGDDRQIAGPGDVYLIEHDGSKKTTALTHGFHGWTGFQIERNAIEDLLSLAGQNQGVVLPGTSAATAVLSEFTQSLKKNIHQLTPELADQLRDSATELLRNAMLLQREPDHFELTECLHHVQNQLMQHIREPELTLDDVAEEIGVSVRKIYRLFQSTGTTPSKWISARRMEMVAQELRRSNSSERGIAQIAQSFGFDDLSHFSRSFKREFGVSPRKYLE